MPVSLMTFHEIFGTMRPDDIPCILAAEREKEYYPNPENLEQKAVSLIGRTVYDLLIKGYTENQWGRAATELPAEIKWNAFPYAQRSTAVISVTDTKASPPTDIMPW